MRRGGFGMTVIASEARRGCGFCDKRHCEERSDEAIQKARLQKNNIINN